CVYHDPLTWTDTKNVGYTDSVPEGRSSVVIYRPADAIEGSTINVYINGEYLSSLQPNAYRQETVCSANQRLYAEFTHQDPGYREKAKDGNYYNLPENQVAFFKIVNANGKPALEQVNADVAKEELKHVKRQNHTLPRVDKVTQCANVLKQYNLDASALFKFNRAAYGDMLVKGKQEVAAVAADIKQNPAKIKDILVIGYTDPEGNAAYNKALSAKRAQTVKQALVKGGVSGNLILTEGRGQADLVVANCRAQFPNNAKARQQCDQPNRRVEIIVHGETK
ncbi:OmpA family protein, partial [Spirabiliibacterium falconis]|uniref:OmpA family protein n=1 Tax=Spirabiliibacterium falconis TaxID=572023 RepID=UPI001AAC92B0